MSGTAELFAGVVMLAVSLYSSIQTPPHRLTVTAEGKGNELVVSHEGGTAIIDVRSRSGIGKATVKLVAGTLPQTIVLRLHLKGLEEFHLSYDRTVITARVSSGDSGGVCESVDSPGGDERPITRESLFWMEVEVVSDQASSRIPLDRGYIKITLPKNFLPEDSRSFSIRWIDFYR